MSTFDIIINKYFNEYNSNNKKNAIELFKIALIMFHKFPILCKNIIIKLINDDIFMKIFDPTYEVIKLIETNDNDIITLTFNHLSNYDYDEVLNKVINMKNKNLISDFIKKV